MEEPIITGVAGDLSEAKITVIGVPDVPGKAAEIFTLVAETGANIDMIVQNVSTRATALTDISFTLPKTETGKVIAALGEARERIGFLEVVNDDNIGKLSVVGGGMKTNAGVSAQLFTALFKAGINIDLISTSEIRISIVTKGEDLAKAMQAVHKAFGLDGDVEAVVYAGTGR
jgi:aspartate kinase